MDLELEVIMGNNNESPVYTGMDKYPGILATVITILIGGIFIGALFMSAGAPH